MYSSSLAPLEICSPSENLEFNCENFFVVPPSSMQIQVYSYFSASEYSMIVKMFPGGILTAANKSGPFRMALDIPGTSLSLEH